MPIDPFGLPDPFAVANAQLGLSPAERATRAPSLPPLSPEDERTLLERIGSTIGGGLGVVAGALNKPGRVIRGLLGGKPREALNLVPFSDALGLTKPEDEVRGQDLLGSSPDTPFLSPEGIAGLGVDILTDPLTYLSFGGSALTKAGLAAKKAGTLPATVAERAAQGLGGHVGVGLPFTGNAATFNLAPVGNAIKSGVETAARFIPGGQAALEAGGKIGSAIGDLYTKTIPPLFQASVMGRKTAPVQEVAQDITAAIPGAKAAARTRGMEFTQTALEHGLAGEEGKRLIRQLGEVPSADPLTMAAQMGLGHMTPEQVAAAKDIATSMQTDLGDILQRKVAGGRPAPELAQQSILQGPGEGERLGYLPRQNVLPEPKTVGAWLRQKTPRLEPEYARKDWTTGMTTDSLNKMAAQPIESMHIPGSTLNPEQQVQKHIMDNYLGGPKAQAEVDRLKDLVTKDQLAHQGVVTDQGVADQLTKAQATQRALENQAAELARIKVAGSLPNFTNHPIVDYVSKVTGENINFLKEAGAYKALASAATAPGADTVPIMEALGKMWKPTETAGESIVDAGGNLVGHTPPLGAQVKMAEALGVPVEQLANMHVPEAVAKDLAGLSRTTTIGGLEEFTKLWDSITNLTKAGQTGWPATVVRNQSQDWFMKFVKGAKDNGSGPMAYIRPYNEWKIISNGGTVPGLAERLGGKLGLTDEAAADALRQKFTAWDVGQNATKRTAMKSGELLDVGNGLAENGLQSLMPISEQKGPLQAYIGGLKEGSVKPKDFFKVAGAFGQTEDVFAPVKAARAAMNANDNLMRGSSWYAFLQQGYSEEQAFARMMETHYDFGNLTGFERGVMRRVVPFYNWMRQNVPAVAKEIMELPGGKLATAVKATEAAKGEHPGFIRPDVAQGLALPLGGEENGTQRYLSGLGLGFEDLGRLLGPGGFVGNLNPLIKYPLETITGKQANTGRDLADLHSRLGDLMGQPMPKLENLVMNSPAGRFLTTAGTLADPRKDALDKAVNLLTGARLTDVDAEAARRSAVRDYIAQQMHGPGISNFTEINVKPENLALLTPEQQRLFQLHRALQNRNHQLPTLP